jgi:predicted TIM-barrel fold metal-dependent hydrolase
VNIRKISIALILVAAALVYKLGATGSGFSIGGGFSGQPEDLDKRLSRIAQTLLNRSLSDIGREPLVDYHAHVIGMGAGGSGAEVDKSMLSWWHPIKKIKTGIFLGACGVSDFNRLDQDYVDRLVRLIRGFHHPIKVHILAMDRYYNPDGTVDKGKVEFYVPNDCVIALAKQYPDVFIPVISVHPHRPDALAELERCGQQGARFLKWLPNAHGIDPSDPRHDGFYKVMRRHNMVLLAHTGKEKSVFSTAQAYGNPLLLRRPLDQGVKVIMAHCASSGKSADLDHPGKQADNFDLFLRMMSVERYRGLLFADISATTQINRTPRPILELIRRPELHDRLVNGSDYPIPAINCVIWTRQLALLGMITDEERKGLNEIYNCNPILFDYVLKRSIRDPSTGTKLPAKVFLNNPGI